MKIILSNKVRDLFRAAKKLGQYGIVLSTLIMSHGVFANTNECFEDITIEPGFMAFSTSKGSQLTQWYKSTFGLKTVKEFSFPDGSVTGELMRKGEFVVEVFQRDALFKMKDYAPNGKQEQWQGFMKVGIYTNANLPNLKRCLNNAGIKAGRIYNDINLGIDLLYVIDPEDNAIEIISRHGK